MRTEQVFRIQMSDADKVLKIGRDHSDETFEYRSFASTIWKFDGAFFEAKRVEHKEQTVGASVQRAMDVLKSSEHGLWILVTQRNNWSSRGTRSVLKERYN